MTNNTLHTEGVALTEHTDAEKRDVKNFEKLINLCVEAIVTPEEEKRTEMMKNANEVLKSLNLSNSLELKGESVLDAISVEGPLRKRQILSTRRLQHAICAEKPHLEGVIEQIGAFNKETYRDIEKLPPVRRLHANNHKLAS